MQVVKNMLTSNANKGPYMKSFFVLLISFVLLGCGSEPDAAIKKLGGRVEIDGESGEVVLVSLSGTQITDAGLVHLKGLTSLTALILNDTQITDEGLAHLNGLTRLTALDLHDTQITDAGLVHLKGLTSLTRLDLYGTQITDAGLAEIRAALPKCNVSK